MKQVVEDLKKARALVDTPEKWCKGTGARNAAENPVSVLSPEAVSRSLVGAYGAVCGFGGNEREFNVICALLSVLEDGSPLYLWNDAPERTHAEVMSAFDAAIKREEERDG